MSDVYFSTSGITGAAQSFYDWSLRKLGSGQLSVELDLQDAIAALEEANNEFSMLVNTYQMKGYWSSIIGQSTSTDLTNKNIKPSLKMLEMIAKAYDDETQVGGNNNLEFGYLSWTGGNQYQDIFSSTTAGYTCSISGKDNTAITADSIKLFEVYYYQQKDNAGFYYDPFYLIRSEYGDYSVAVNGGMAYNYIYPLWADIANSNYLKTMATFRRSNYKYLYAGRRLFLYPTPRTNMKIWCKFKIGQSVVDSIDPSSSGVSNISNAPFTNFNYEAVNEISQDWIRKYAFAVMKEILGRIRSFTKEVPLPNGSIILDGEALLSESEENKKELKEWLLKELEEMRPDKIMIAEAEKMKAVNDQLKYVPVMIYKK